MAGKAPKKCECGADQKVQSNISYETSSETKKGTKITVYQCLDPKRHAAYTKAKGQSVQKTSKKKRK